MKYTILSRHHAGVLELVDEVDSKSTGGNTVPVRARPPAPAKQGTHKGCPVSLMAEYGIEPISMELSGGQFLQPVQKLVATIILTSLIEKLKCKSIPLGSTMKKACESVLFSTKCACRYEK